MNCNCQMRRRVSAQLGVCRVTAPGRQPPVTAATDCDATATWQIDELRPINDVSGIDMPARKQTFLSARGIHVKCETSMSVSGTY